MKPLTLKEIEDSIARSELAAEVKPDIKYWKRLLHTARLAHEMRDALKGCLAEVLADHEAEPYLCKAESADLASEALKLWQKLYEIAEGK